MFWPPKMSHSIIQYCCRITLQVSHHEGQKTVYRLSKMESKTNFSRRMKQFELWWLDLTDSVPDPPYYAALLPRRGPHIASHSVCLSVCPSVPLSSVTWRHLANYNDTHVLFGRGPHIVRPSRPHKFLFYNRSTPLFSAYHKLSCWWSLVSSRLPDYSNNTLKNSLVKYVHCICSFRSFYVYCTKCIQCFCIYFTDYVTVKLC